MNFSRKIFQYKINYFNNKFNGEIRSGPNHKIRKVGPSDREDVFKEATWRVLIRGKALSFESHLSILNIYKVSEV